jgi:hypothetical protein
MVYKVVKSDNWRSLETMVNDLLKMGWDLQGGVSISMNTDQGRNDQLFAQALVKLT